MKTLASPESKAGSVAAQVVAAIASVELPVGEWPEAIELLLRFVQTSDNVNLKVSTFQAIGYICESIVSYAHFFSSLGAHAYASQKPDVLAVRSNEILTAVIHGARKEESSTNVQQAAINALFNSLEFVRENMDREVRPHKYTKLHCSS